MPKTRPKVGIIHILILAHQIPPHSSLGLSATLERKNPNFDVIQLLKICYFTLLVFESKNEKFNIQTFLFWLLHFLIYNLQ
jgi:hypothetical protein